jgi:dTDP-D-glucose 4,6-dehydratase
MTLLVTGGAGFIGGNFVLDWLDLHQAELMEDWALAQVRKALKPIAPLE